MSMGNVTEETLYCQELLRASFHAHHSSTTSALSSNGINGSISTASTTSVDDEVWDVEHDSFVQEEQTEEESLHLQNMRLKAEVTDRELTKLMVDFEAVPAIRTKGNKGQTYAITRCVVDGVSHYGMGASSVKNGVSAEEFTTMEGLIEASKDLCQAGKSTLRMFRGFTKDAEGTEKSQTLHAEMVSHFGMVKSVFKPEQCHTMATRTTCEQCQKKIGAQNIDYVPWPNSKNPKSYEGQWLDPSDKSYSIALSVVTTKNYKPFQNNGVSSLKCKT